MISDLRIFMQIYIYPGNLRNLSTDHPLNIITSNILRVFYVFLHIIYILCAFKFQMNA